MWNREKMMWSVGKRKSVEFLVSLYMVLGASRHNFFNSKF